ncbi:c-type cytochrome [Flocculibacter collagenilyticus]|uniref:c-type cytochrome n=1 Tax=Flocculibacter collagenilyticus TaxID=2744479 RepID=UPI0018F724C5|nr:cytochrome c [Flocculibacter collagenilyticus]
MKLLAKTLLCASVCALTLSSTANANDSFKHEIDARQSYMQVLRHNIGQLGAMAKGKKPYDAELAKAAAQNLALAASMNNAFMWPKGSDNANAKNTDALPAIWDQLAKVKKINGDMKEASENLAKHAGNGLSEVRKYIGAVGKTCKGCHDDFKAE